MNKLELMKTANEVRKGIVTAVHSAKAGHPGGSLSAADIFTYLYFEEMNIDPKDPKNPNRDRFVLSKGHTAPGLYSVLAQRGYFPVEDLKTLRHTGSVSYTHLKNLTAIVGLNDMIAFGILDALYDEKYKVPKDMSVMGCDNTLFANLHKVSLTTIEHFVIYKGMDACEIIMKKIHSRDQRYTEMEPVSIYHVEYEPRIVVRGTTSYPKNQKRK